MARVVVILGAGASTPFFDPPLSTVGLTSAVTDESMWQDLLVRYHQVAQGANQIEPRAVNDLLADLQARGLCGNFEDYIEIVDKIASYAFDSSHGKILHNLINLLQGELHFYPTHTWTAVPFLFRQAVAERIQETQENHRATQYQDLVKVFGEFLKYLSQKTELSVASFNYDDVLFDALASAGCVLEDGFNNNYYEASRYLNGRHILGFLHGHARYVMEGSKLRRYPTIGDANSNRLANLYSATQNETKYLTSGLTCYNFNTFIVTGRDKDSGLNENPYAAYYQRLAHDLLTAELVVVAGFSLQDPHIRRLLINFRKLRTDNRVLIVDIDNEPGPIDVLVGFQDPSSFIYRLLDTLDVQCITFSENRGQNRYEFQAGVDELNDTGVGEIYPQISFCKLGFEGFLQDYRAILQKTCSL